MTIRRSLMSGPVSRRISTTRVPLAAMAAADAVFALAGVSTSPIPGTRPRTVK